MNTIPRSRTAAQMLVRRAAPAFFMGSLLAFGASAIAAPGDVPAADSPTLVRGLFRLPDAALTAHSPDAGDAAPSTSKVAESSVKGLGHALSSADLDRYRGGAQVLNVMELNGVVANNVASQVATGSNAISANAFTGFSGLGNVIQNSGANVLIQNATILNVEFK
ncbi:hypothetical protein PTE30175_00420 [Pandoraea terrae]|uniref:Uncharacterized protein n=1 Tax=Pandoraea terrae TaxID=1537710 RepID=A0A5E4RWR8_9BURK|nr:hypothetical protein [Pandoraea terrae]VVD67980.1 hypothetical protein PTE30175_00420 [Pandoraea terrae]